METSYTSAEKSVGLFVIGIAVLLMTTVVILGGERIGLPRR
jgi:hypothetical protein